MGSAGPHAWHAVDVSEAFARLESRDHGLGEAEVVARRALHGPNRLPHARAPAFALVALRQFRSPLIYVLGGAAVVAVAIGDAVDAAFILGILVLNAAIGSVQEWRAERSSHALQRLVKTRATVVREGESLDVDAEELVPGDVIWLDAGNRVPADARLAWARGLEVDESLLTGESVPVAKTADSTASESTALGDRVGMVHAGSIVTRGRARGLVVATGSDTVVGRLAREVTGSQAGAPPLLVRLERFTRVIGAAALVAAALVAVIGIVLGDYPPGQMFLFAVALAVSAIPEGLPVALTVALAVATRRMARRGVIVRKLAAVEGLGSCTLIASDKTGTLTCNELTVRSVALPGGRRFAVSGPGYVPQGEVTLDGHAVRPADAGALERVARIAALCNDATLNPRNGKWTWRGDPTDIALLAFAYKVGLSRESALDRFPPVNQIPFEPERKYAATFHRAGATTLICVKGAPERILDMCFFADTRERAATLDAARALAAEGYRVLAFADGEVLESVAAECTPEEPRDLSFAGFAGMIDPLRAGARDAIATCARAGIRTTMITGDHPVTAFAIARDLGLAASADEVVTGLDLEAATEREYADLVRRVRVFARMGPQQKLLVVKAAKAAGHFVAVTGDGVNDAAALRSANIGVAMGKGGTDVAREAAELVITDDDFATIVGGVEEGRIAYDNVRKVIYLLVSTGAAEVVLVLASMAAGMPLPLLPVQLLWLNLVTNGIQDVALAFEPGEPHALRRPPRPPEERIFDRLMIERTLIAAVVMGLVGFGAFRWMLDAGWAESDARNALLLLMVLFENVHIGNCRSETTSLLRMSPLRSRTLLIGAVLAFGVHLASLYVLPLRAVLGTSPVSVETWLALGSLSLTVAVAMELHKFTWRLRHPAGPEARRRG